MLLRVRLIWKWCVKFILLSLDDGSKQNALVKTAVEAILKFSLIEMSSGVVGVVFYLIEFLPNLNDIWAYHNVRNELKFNKLFSFSEFVTSQLNRM